MRENEIDPRIQEMVACVQTFTELIMVVIFIVLRSCFNEQPLCYEELSTLKIGYKSN